MSGEPQSGTQRLCQIVSNKWCPLVPFWLRISHKVTKSMPNSSVGCVVNYSQLSTCQGKMEPFKNHLSTSVCLTSLRNKPQHKLPGQLLAPILAQIVNVYNYDDVVLLVCLTVVCIELAIFRSSHMNINPTAVFQYTLIGIPA